jgi:predicted outer membrane repeat protein
VEDGDALDLVSNEFCGNSVPELGGGAIHGSDLGAFTISYNVFVNQSATGKGGAVHLRRATGVLHHNHFVGNTTVLFGGAVYADDSTLDFNSNLVAFNGRRQGLYVEDSTATVAYNAWWQQEGEDATGVTLGGTEVFADPNLFSNKSIHKFNH